MRGRRRRRCTSRLRSSLRQLLAFLFSNVGVVVLVLGYTIAGAFMFQKIEGASEIERAHNMALERNATALYLWQNVTLALNPFNETQLVRGINRELRRYQRRVVEAARRGWDGGRTSRQWSFSSAFLYSLTVITTIGYGNLSPRTSLGKITTIVYALLGMPLFLLYLSNLGSLLARWFKCVYALLCLCRGCPGLARRRRRLEPVAPIYLSGGGWEARRSSSGSSAIYCHKGYDGRAIEGRGWRSPERGGPGPCPDPSPSPSPVTSEFSYVTFDPQSITVPISVCVAILVGYILFGSMLFGLWEEWEQLDGAYFCFISLSSIGFGDFVPGERVYTQKIETSFIACSLYLMLGMALVAMCFNLMQEQVIHYFAGIKRALGRICRCSR